MNKKTLISSIKEKYPTIENLSDRTWDEVAEAMLHLYDSEWNPIDAMALVFKSISGQIRYEISRGIRMAIDKNGCPLVNDITKK